MFLAFLKVLSFVTGGVWICLIPTLYFFAESPIIWGIVSGWLLAAGCFIGGFYLICRTFRGDLRSFLMAVMGGAFVRMLVIGVIFVLLVKLLQLHMTSFVSSLAGFYILYLAIELYFVTRLQHQEGA